MTSKAHRRQKQQKDATWGPAALNDRAAAVERRPARAERVAVRDATRPPLVTATESDVDRANRFYWPRITTKQKQEKTGRERTHTRGRSEWTARARGGTAAAAAPGFTTRAAAPTAAIAPPSNFDLVWRASARAPCWRWSSVVDRGTSEPSARRCCCSLALPTRLPPVFSVKEGRPRAVPFMELPLAVSASTQVPSFVYELRHPRLCSKRLVNREERKIRPHTCTPCYRPGAENNKLRRAPIRTS